MKERMTIERWYGGSLRLPMYNNTEAVLRFTASSVGIVSSIVRRTLGKEIRVTFAKVPTAHADQEQKKIVINEEFLNGHFLPGQPPIYDSSKLAAILGIVVHEAGHFAFSPATLLPFVEYIKDRTTCAFSKGVALSLSNIIEDIYIEAEIDRIVPNLTWMLDETSRIFFSGRDTNAWVVKVMGIISEPTTMEEVADVLNVMLLAKVQESITCNSFIETLFYQALEARDLPKLEDRFELCLQLYEQVMKNIKSISEPEELEVLKVLSDAKGLCADNQDEEGEDWLGTQLTSVFDNINDQLSDTDLEIPITEVFGEKAHPATVIMEKPVSASPNSLAVDERYLKLSEVARQHAVVNRPYGMQKTKGNHIRNLYRISTDQKIFAEPVTMNSYKPMQVVILIDCSGSMRQRDDRQPDARIVMASKAALGATIALMEAHCEVAVYAHTADLYARGDMMVYRLKSFSEPVTELSSRLFQLIDRELKGNNRDSCAVEYVGAKLQNANRRRLLIVYSDGFPISHNYGGQDAINHGKAVVANLKRKGIDVLSISITKEAASSNEEMYGKSNNVFNQDPNVIEDIVRRLIGVD